MHHDLFFSCKRTECPFWHTVPVSERSCGKYCSWLSKIPYYILFSLMPAISDDVLYCTTTRDNSLPHLSILVNYHTQKSHLNEAYSCETHRNLFFPGRKMADRHYNDSYEQYEEPYPYEGRDRMVRQILNQISSA